MKLVNRVLPEAGGNDGNQSRAGFQLGRSAPQRPARLADRAMTKNNEEKREVP
jgi:hypothetical protein